MVYIFFVQSGDMTTFDKEISIMQSVEDLKDKIAENIGIPKEQQVLLVSGGESLDSKKNLCSYMAGTDTNPIYLFSTNYDVCNLGILKNLNYCDKDLKQKLIDSMKLPVSLETVTLRTQLAIEYHEVAKKQLEFCETMVHEQHLQQQGWSAVIANLDDIISEFRKRWDLFLKFYDEFMTERKTYYDILAHFQEDKDILMRVPVIDILLEMQREPMDSSKLSEVTNASQENDSKETTLYEWISSDSKNSLEKLHEECLSKLEKFEMNIMPILQKNVCDTLKSAEAPERKEIEGLGKRLFDLEELLSKIKKYVEHQSDMAQAFQQNRNSASQAKDLSILPDLCTTHERQLEYIKKYHQKLMDDRDRVIKAKHELSKSLCVRIGWVQSIENKLWELDSHLVYFHECLQRLRKHIEVFQQVHLAPSTYVNSIVEVVRRRSFSQLFLLWASNLACQQLTIYNEELTRRKEFNAQFEGHFLNALFPGMGDVPPAFATEAPAMFDAKLPDITQEDIEKLKKDLPDFADSLTLPDMEHVTNFFLGKNPLTKESDKEKVDDTKAVEEKLIQAVSDVGLASNLDKNLLKATGSETCLVTAHALQNIRSGCESETDTEEFEKVVQSPLELTFPQEAASGVSPASQMKEKQELFRSIEVRNQVLPPKKPPRSFHRAAQSFDIDPLQRTLSISTNESFTNIKNMSLDSIDELSSIKNFSNTSESYFNSHCNQTTSRDHPNFPTSTSSLHLSEAASLSNLLKSTVTSHYGNSSLMLGRSKSVSPQSPREGIFQDNASPQMGHQPDFVNDEFYIDESLPSSVGTGNSQGSEFVRQLDTANIVVAMLQDNLQISRSEYEKVKAVLMKVDVLARQDMERLRDDLKNLTAYFLAQSEEFSNLHDNLGGSWRSLVDEVAKNEKDIADVLLKEHEAEKESYRYNLLEKDEIIAKLEKEKKVIEERNEELSRELKNLEEKFDEEMSINQKIIDNLDDELKLKDFISQKSIKALSERIGSPYIYNAFGSQATRKLEAIGKWISLPNMHKDESGELLCCLPSHDILTQREHDNELARNYFDQKARYEELMTAKCEQVYERAERDFEIRLQTMTKRIVDEKEKQIDLLRERDRNLNLEVTKLKITLQQLAENQQQPVDMNVRIAIDDLNKEKERLQEEVRKIKAEREHLMTASVSVCEEKLDASTSPPETAMPYDLSRSEISPRQRRLNIDTCRAGDIVLVLWDAKHHNYKILQESKHIYFLHSDSLEVLGLTIVDNNPNKAHCIGEVIDKEYCHARKNRRLGEYTEFISEKDGSVKARDEVIYREYVAFVTFYDTSNGNRYKVPKGTKFFRVKVKPIDVAHHGRSMSASHSTMSTFEPVQEESPNVATDPSKQEQVKIASDRIVVEHPEEIKPASVEKNFAEDSGIVENVEQAMAAVEDIDKLRDDRVLPLTFDLGC
ncbi:autophagy-related 17 isoform X2 [Rhynchophorus ferrugineus]|uniref:autophagy-related 17 isoform X2 n=1 Tax=Rhynchophorus ferrugineus TaxID=354439 RepID=UPI003FCE2261